MRLALASSTAAPPRSTTSADATRSVLAPDIATIAEQGVPRDVEVPGVHEPRLVDLLRAQLCGDSAVGAHGPFAARIDERDDDAVAGGLDGPEQLDPELDEARRGQSARVVGAALADKPGRAAEGRDGA